MPVKAEPKTITVPDDYPTIADAIGNTTDGDTILVKKGIHDGPINQTLQISKAISLKGESTNDTKILLHPPIIQYMLFGTLLQGYANPIKIEANNVKLEGLTIASVGGGISIAGNAVQLSGNILELPVVVENSNEVRIASNRMGSVSISGSNNIILGNTIAGISVDGVRLKGGSFNVVYNNTLVNAGLYIEGPSNVVYGNSIKAGSISANGDENLIAKNNVTGGVGTGLSIYVEKGSSNLILANRIIDGDGIAVGIGLNNTFHANHVENNGIGLTIGGSKTETANNTFYENNFVGNTHQVWTGNEVHGNEYFDYGKNGNYWSDYAGVDFNSDGIGDTPYPVYASYWNEQDTESKTLLGHDNYPLISPVDSDNIAVRLPEWVSLLLSPSPTDTPSNTVPEPFPVIPVAAVSVAAVMIGAGLLVYFKKRKR
jgi:nitrous oxidase accessory protein